MGETNKGRLYILLTAVCFSLGGICVKSITWSSLSINCVRSIISLMMLLAYKKSFKLNFSKTNVLGAVLTALTSILYMLANKLTTAGTTIVLEYIAPILVFLFEVCFRKRDVVFSEVIITFLVFNGCVLSFADNIDMSHIIGNILAICSGFTYAGQLIVMSSNDSNSQDVVIIANGISFLVSLPFLLTDKNLVFSVNNIVWVLILSVFQYGMANIFLSIGSKMVDSVESSLILTIEPILNPIFVLLINGERMGPLAVIGSVLVIASVTFHTIISSKKYNISKKRGEHYD